MNLHEMSALLGHTFKGEKQVISQLAYDSRQVEAGSVFFAIRGQDQDGHQYIEKAIEKGAIAIVGEEDLTLEVPYFQVFNTKKALAIVSNVFFGKPSKDISLVGVIGTNGKTTITYLIQHVFECLGVDRVLIGPNGSWVAQNKKATHTTPMSVDLNDLLQEGVKHNLPYLVMEVSSHGIKENRVDQIQFDRLIFTNITPEHLDYHKTFEDYLFTKMRPFIQLSDYDEDKVAIINCDDEHATDFIGATNGKILTYGCQARADLFAEDIVYTLERTEFSLYVKGEYVTRMAIPLFGKYNVYNVLSVLAYFYSLGYDLLKIVSYIENVSSIEGRFEYIKTNDDITVVIDYAHNPDAIFQVLTCLNVIANGNIITVLGAGGNRDKAKRKIMGRHATRLSDHVFFTSDNPRNEDPLSIIYDLLSGTSSVNYTVIVDRAKAIEAAIKKAKPNDLVVVLGKGHEKTQNINGKIVPFSDKIVVEEVIRKRGI
ncbi:MAG: UDP-N-acetylmuramoyl-L-alanyl-D-glutamate--2,6-diaminopimelate ligase [Turicibacter sp.]|nr:UDP-N-acetylmuramoyl-L-alanyl-D-glutamate--2,6-diaminopimelate ligase [Turicibacter sp.]